tara:strand:- start:109 stop:459 length:351 start_codon:yes stop_codon:yes gene_type:complete
LKSIQFKRSDRVSHQIKEIISEIFTTKASIDGAGLITVTNVKTTDNLRFSRIYISFVGNNIEPHIIIDQMNYNIREYRYQLGKSIKVKYVPQIKFYYDDSMDEAEKINALINKSKK